MNEPFGRRDTLIRRIQYGNYAANTFAVIIIVALVAALDSDTPDVWVIGGIFSTAALVSTVRYVTAMRIELYQMGRPGPGLVVDNDDNDDEWN